MFYFVIFILDAVFLNYDGNIIKIIYCLHMIIHAVRLARLDIQLHPSIVYVRYNAL